MKKKRKRQSAKKRPRSAKRLDAARLALARRALRLERSRAASLRIELRNAKGLLQETKIDLLRRLLLALDHRLNDSKQQILDEYNKVFVEYERELRIKWPGDA